MEDDVFDIDRAAPARMRWTNSTSTQSPTGSMLARPQVARTQGLVDGREELLAVHARRVVARRCESWFTSCVAYRRTARTEARIAETRERIVDAALAQVADGGYASAGVQAVATRAGVATGSVYRHFPSKADLFGEVFRLQATQELDVLEEVVSGNGPVRERLAAGTEVLARRALASPTLAYSQIAEPVEQEVEAERLVLRRGYRDAFARLLREGVESGELEALDAETYGAAILGALSEALVGPLSDPDPRDKEALIASLVQFMTKAVPWKHLQPYGTLPSGTDFEPILNRPLEI